MAEPNGGVSRVRRKPIWLRVTAVVFLVLLTAYAGLFWFLRNPIILAADAEPGVTADVDRLKRDVWALTSIKPSRTFRNPSALSLAADHIEAEFTKAGCAVASQEVPFLGKTYRNISCSFGPSDGPRVVIGAHYDVQGADNPGADDNASGVAGVLEIARLVGAAKPTLAHRLDLVAFTLEEVRGVVDGVEQVNIGSYYFARALKARQDKVKLMISVEMIGYFSSEPGSQTYPPPLSGFLKLFYPGTGNFIGIIGQALDRAAVSRVKELMTVSDDLPVYSINAPAFVPSIDRSDHQSFWAMDYPAVMVTDTAEFRNPNYHRSGDAADTLDYERMAAVVEGLYETAVKY